MDRLYKWNSVANSPIQDAMARQEEYVRKEFEDRLNQVRLIRSFILCLCKKCRFGLDRLDSVWRSGAPVPPAPAPHQPPHHHHHHHHHHHPAFLLVLQVMLQLNEQGLNVALYWKNRDPRSFINIVPTSAITGEGAPGRWCAGWNMGSWKIMGSWGARGQPGAANAPLGWHAPPAPCSSSLATLPRHALLSCCCCRSP